MSEQEGEAQGHPAWQEILSALEEVPEEFRALVEPKLTEKLQAWDQGVNGKLQAVRSEYEGYEAYKPLIENKVEVDRVQKALWLADKLEQDPNYIVQQAIEAFGLDYAPKGAVTPPDPAGNVDPDEEDFGNGEFDITKHPQFQQIQQRLNAWEQERQREREAQEQQQHISALEQEIVELHEKFDTKLPDGTVVPGFNDLYVTALMAQGLDGEQAVKSFTDVFNQQAQALGLNQQQTQQEPPPVVMGGDGNTGSGIPNQPTNFGSLSNDDLDNIVLQMIEADKQA